VNGDTLTLVNLRSTGDVSDTFSIVKALEVPRVLSTSPPKGNVLGSLALVEVTFTTGVTGVDAADLTVNGSPATAVSAQSAQTYVFSGFAPTLLGGGTLGQNVFMLVGFVLLGLSYGQASGTVTSNFIRKYRYTGAALTADLAWLIGAAFAPLVALGLSANFGLAYVSVYLLSGAACTLAALTINRALEARGDES